MSNHERYSLYPPFREDKTDDTPHDGSESSLNGLFSCPMCHGESGYEKRMVARLTTTYTWNDDTIDTIKDYISGAKRKYCLDCGKYIGQA